MTGAQIILTRVRLTATRCFIAILDLLYPGWGRTPLDSIDELPLDDVDARLTATLAPTRWAPPAGFAARVAAAAGDPPGLSDVLRGRSASGGRRVRPPVLLALPLVLIGLLACWPAGRHALETVAADSLRRLPGQRASATGVELEPWEPSVLVDVDASSADAMRAVRVLCGPSLDADTLRREYAGYAMQRALRGNGWHADQREAVAALLRAEPENGWSWMLHAATLHPKSEAMDQALAEAAAAPRLDTGAEERLAAQLRPMREQSRYLAWGLLPQHQVPALPGRQWGGSYVSRVIPSLPEDMDRERLLERLAALVTIGRRLQEGAVGLEDWDTGGCLLWQVLVRYTIRFDPEGPPPSPATHRALAADLRRLGREADARHIEALSAEGALPFELLGAGPQLSDAVYWRYQYLERLRPLAVRIQVAAHVAATLLLQALLLLALAALARWRRRGPAAPWRSRDVAWPVAVALPPALLACGLATGLGVLTTLVETQRQAELAGAVGTFAASMLLEIVRGMYPLVWGTLILLPPWLALVWLVRRAGVRWQERSGLPRSARRDYARAIAPGAFTLGAATLLLVAAVALGVGSFTGARLDAELAAMPAAERQAVVEAQAVLADAVEVSRRPDAN